MEKAPAIAHDLSLARLAADLIAVTPYAAFPVVEDGKVVGIVSAREARKALLDPSTDHNAPLSALVREVPVFLPDDDLEPGGARWRSRLSAGTYRRRRLCSHAARPIRPKIVSAPAPPLAQPPPMN